VTQPVSKLRIDEDQAGDITILRLRGEIVSDDGDLLFGRRVDDLIKRGLKKVVVNLSDVTYIDSAGVGMMVYESKMLQEKQGIMKLAHLSARSHHLLAMLKLKLVFEIYEDEAAAIDSFKWGTRT
jgi:anti-sigma B factor antagonist